MQNTTKSTSTTNPQAQASKSSGCCGSHGDISPGSANVSAAEVLRQGILDVRPLPPARRHSLIFETFDGLKEGGSFVLVNDHDPKPLYYQFAYEKAGIFTWNYEEQGPEVWRVRIGKTAPQSVLKSPKPATH